ncbi:hypothetical protein ABID08_006118 [Rhizobium binae]|uniref:Transposase DDE domain-containing protein n=1 Tax=Rhizobium binae TaxID=1138190 RepID=A0ABV2MRF0_9HYPH
MTIAGVLIPAESKVLVGLPATSVDPRHLDDPEIFEIGRALKPHLAFSYWPHYCIGLALASLELKAVFGTISSASPRCAWPWRRGQHRYSDLAIETTLTLGLVFGLRLRQAEGLVESVLQLMGLALAVPDHTTLSRRARAWRSEAEDGNRAIQVHLGGVCGVSRPKSPSAAPSSTACLLAHARSRPPQGSHVTVSRFKDPHPFCSTSVHQRH